VLKVFLGLFILILFFQNCDSNLNQRNSLKSGPAEKNQKSLESSYGGNGDPYSGKLTYMAFEPGHTCPDSSGKQISAPLGKIVPTDDGYNLEFQACAETSRRLSTNEIEKIDLGSETNLLFENHLYLPFKTMPDIATLHIPDKFCTETQALTNSNSSFTFYQLSTYKTYASGNGIDIYQRQVTDGLLQFELVNQPLHFNNVVFEEINNIQKWLLDTFSLNLDLNSKLQVYKNNFNFTSYTASGAWQSSGNNVQTEMTCTLIPIEPYYFTLAPPPNAGKLPPAFTPSNGNLPPPPNSGNMAILPPPNITNSPSNPPPLSPPAGNIPPPPPRH
jgi:hypothetical protein